MRMQCTAATASGTFLWSDLLLTSRETGITHLGSGQGGGVHHGLPLHRCKWGTNPRVRA